MNFIAAIQGTLLNTPDTVGENGTPSHSTTGKAHVNLYYSVLRGTGKDRVEELVSAAWDQDPLSTAKLVFQMRDCRAGNPGKGERDVYYHAMRWVLDNHPDQALHFLNSGHIEHFGYFKDLFKIFMDTEYESHMLEYYSGVLKKDLDILTRFNNGETVKDSVSLAAKWSPNPNCKSRSGKHKRNAKKLAEKMFGKGFVIPQYRKARSALNRHIRIVERFMCSQEWDEINFSQVPSVAMKNYRNAFKRHCEEELTAFLNRVQAGEATIKAGQLMPHQMVIPYMNGGSQVQADPVLEAQWKEFVKPFLDSGEKGNPAFAKALVISDVSGSMSGTPMQCAIALGILIAQAQQHPAFKNKLITFSENPEFHEINHSDSLAAKVRSVSRMKWGMNTNYLAVHKLILNAAKENSVPQSDFPTRIYVLSDMQFDHSVMSGDRKTLHQTIKELYDESEYSLPEMVFWNLRGDTSDCPVTALEGNVAMISGFSPSVLTTVLDGELPNPEVIVRKLINHPAYDRVNIVSE